MTSGRRTGAATSATRPTTSRSAGTTEQAKTVLEGFGDFDTQVAAELAAQMQEVGE